MEIAPETRILIVDDNPQNIKVLGTILKENGFQINVAINGREALVMAEKVLPDLIMMDIMMPEMGGFDACRKLKEMEETKEIPVIFLTAKTRIESIVEGFELGAVDYVTKPFDATELLVRVETHLKIAHLQNELRKANDELEQRVIEKTTTILNIEKTLQSEVDESIISSLDADIKTWFVDALKGMLVIDGRMADPEIAFLRTILTFLGDKGEAERLLKMIKLREPPNLTAKSVDPETGFALLTILMKLAIVDDKLNQSEAGYMYQLGRLLGFDNNLIKRMLNWGNSRLKANHEHKQLKNMFLMTQKNFQQGPQNPLEAKLTDRALNAEETDKKK